jgi:hypothetical protein
MTMAQTMQARKLRCWPGGTKFSDMVACAEETKLEIESNGRTIRDLIRMFGRKSFV